MDNDNLKKERLPLVPVAHPPDLWAAYIVLARLDQVNTVRVAGPAVRIHWAEIPPSTKSADPVVKLESSQERKSAALATSSGEA